MVEGEAVVDEQSGKTKDVANAEQIRKECKPIATRFLKQISLYANNRYRNGGQMTAAICIACAERAILFLATKLPREGQKAFIESVYDGAKKDAIEFWELG